MKTKEVILKLHLKSTFCQKIYLLFANYMVNVWFLQCGFWWGSFCPIMCLYVPSSVLWCPLRFPHKTMFGSSLPPIVCV